MNGIVDLTKLAPGHHSVLRGERLDDEVTQHPHSLAGRCSLEARLPKNSPFSSILFWLVGLDNLTLAFSTSMPIPLPHTSR